jgi:hypothetical protein
MHAIRMQLAQLPLASDRGRHGNSSDMRHAIIVAFDERERLFECPRGLFLRELAQLGNTVRTQCHH